MEKRNYPLMYNGYIIRKCSNGKLSAYSYKTDYFINPLYDTFDALKIIIDALK